MESRRRGIHTVRLGTLIIVLSTGLGVSHGAAEADTIAPAQYHGGPVMPTSTTYAIYWSPPVNGQPTQFEPPGSPSTNPNCPNAATSDAVYRCLINRYFTDVGGTSFYNSLTQYSTWQGNTVQNGPIQNTSNFGGYYVDTSDLFPHAGTTSDPLQDSDIQAEIKQAVSAQGWSVGLNSIVFVFTPYNIQICSRSLFFNSDCTYDPAPNGWCGYHNSTITSLINGQTIIYSVIASIPSGCSVPESPNNDLTADSAISVVSHEQFEAVTDPFGQLCLFNSPPICSGWWSTDAVNGRTQNDEIGDKCRNGLYGAISSDANLVLRNSHRYLVQEEWSNALSSCYLPVTLDIQWGSPAWGIPLNRRALLEVRAPGSSVDLFSQAVQTDSSGSYQSLDLAGLAPGTYDVYLKPNGFLRQEQSSVYLDSGINDLTFSLTKTGFACVGGGAVVGKPLAGDINGDNVINSEDYNLFVTYYNQPIPSNVADIHGTGIMDGADYNAWIQSTCYFGHNNSDVVGDGGRVDGNLNVTTASSLRQANHRKRSSAIPLGTMTFTPIRGTYQVGQSFTVQVQASSAGYLVDGADAVVDYDPSLLQVKSLSPGTLFPQMSVLENSGQKGEVNITGIANQNQPLAINGLLASITFQAINPGTADITFDYNPISTARTGMPQNQTGEQVLGYVYSAEFGLTAPWPPTGPSNAQAVALDSTDIALSWTDNSNNEDGFQIYNESTQALVATVGPNVTSYAVTGLLPKTNYCYDIYAYNSYGQSGGWTRACAFTPAVPTATPTQTSTPNQTPTGTSTPTNTPTATSSSTPTNSATPIPSNTSSPTATSTATPTVTVTNTPTKMSTQTATPTNTATATPTSTATASPTPPAGGSQVTVPANQPWIDTGIQVPSYPAIGFTWRFNAWGTVYTSTVTSGIGPDGNLSCIAGADWLVPGAPCGALVGRFGTNGTPFFIGSISISGDMDPLSSPADLFLSVNDQVGSYADNSGSWTVNVKFTVDGYWPTSTPTLTPSMTPYPTNTATTTSSPTNTASPSSTATATVMPTNSPTSSPTNTPMPAAIVVNAPTVAPFQSVTITGTSFGPLEMVNIYADSTAGTPLYSATTTASGSFVLHSSARQGSYGPHTLIAVGQVSHLQATASVQIKPAVFLSPTSGKAGSVVTLIGAGFGPTETVAGLWYPGFSVLSAASSNAVGTVVMTFTIPQRTPGTYYVLGYGTRTRAYALASISVTSVSAGTRRMSLLMRPALPRSLPSYVGKALKHIHSKRTHVVLSRQVCKKLGKPLRQAFCR